MKLVLATNNIHKIREITKIMAGLNVELLTAADFSDFPDPDETGTTLEENAIIKAIEIFRATGIPALADDSGLEVDYLGGKPGVLSSRFAGPGCSFADNNRKLLESLDGVAEKNRTARFRCVAALALNEDDIRFFEGSVEGRITPDLQGREGFGYDPVFFFPEAGKTFAEISEEEKNRYSHRGQAFRKAAAYLRELID